MQDALSKDFGPEAVKYKPGRGGSGKLAYVSHGMINKRLNDVDPDWHAAMVERWITEAGGALHCLGGVMRLTVGGVTREEAGGPARLTTLADDLKNTYSDCLKRCAMRFGVALSLWESAEEGDEDAMPWVKGEEGVGPDFNRLPPTPRAPVQQRPPQRAQQAPQAAPVVLTEAQNKALADARDSAEASVGYEATKAGYSHSRTAQRPSNGRRSDAAGTRSNAIGIRPV